MAPALQIAKLKSVTKLLSGKFCGHRGNEERRASQEVRCLEKLRLGSTPPKSELSVAVT